MNQTISQTKKEAFSKKMNQYTIKTSKSVTSYDRKTGKKINKQVVGETEEVDARVFFLPILESLNHPVLKEAVIEMKNDLYSNK